MNADLLRRDQSVVDMIAATQLRRAAQGHEDALCLLLRCLKTAAVLKATAMRHGIDLNDGVSAARCSQLRSLEVGK